MDAAALARELVGLYCKGGDEQPSAAGEVRLAGRDFVTMARVAVGPSEAVMAAAAVITATLANLAWSRARARAEGWLGADERPSKRVCFAAAALRQWSGARQLGVAA